MNIARIQEAFVKKIESLDLRIPIFSPNALPKPKPNEFIELVVSETGRVVIQQDLEHWLGAADCKITVEISTGHQKIYHYADKITEAFSVLDNSRCYVTTKDGIVLTVTNIRQFPLYTSGTTCSVNCRISFDTFLQIGE